MSRLLCAQVDAVQSGAIFGASLVRMFRAVAIDADLVRAIITGEDSAVFFAVEGLVELRTAIHADKAYFELFGESSTVKLAICSCLWRLICSALPERRSLPRELANLLDGQVRLADVEHAFDLIRSVFFDLKAEPGFPAFCTNTFMLIMLGLTDVLRRDLERADVRAAVGAIFRHAVDACCGCVMSERGVCGQSRCESKRKRRRAGSGDEFTCRGPVNWCHMYQRQE